MLVQHGRLAIETGVLPENVFIIENGTPIEIFADGSARRGQPVAAGYVYVDGLSVGEVGDVVLRDRRALANDGMFMVVVQIDKQTDKLVGRPEIITRGFVHGNEEDPADRRGDPADPRGGRRAGRPDHRGRAAQGPDQGQRVALPVRADEAPADGLPRGGRGLAHGHAAAGRPRATTPRRRTQARKSGRPAGAQAVAGRCRRPSSGRWSGIFLLVLGAVTLIALLLPGQGSLTDWWRNLSVPFFGTGRWLLPFVLLLSGWYVEWGPGKEPGAPWGRTLLGIAMAYAGFLGLMQLVNFSETTGGRIGRALTGILEPLLTTPGAFVILVGALRRGPAHRLRPAAAGAARRPRPGLAKAAGSTLQDRVDEGRRRRPAPAGWRSGRVRRTGCRRATALAAASVAEAGRRGKGAQGGRRASRPARRASGATAGGRPAVRRPVDRARPRRRSRRCARRQRRPRRRPPSLDGRRVHACGRRARHGPARRHGRVRLARTRATRSPGSAAAQGAARPRRAADGRRRRERRTRSTPGTRRGSSRSSRASTSRPRITGRNAGPVVTQYEVHAGAAHQGQPDRGPVRRPRRWPSRPGASGSRRRSRARAPSGIEIPNKEFNVVALRRILDEVDFAGSGSTLTFALGRDVAGQGAGRRPREDAPPADRGRHRLGQERDGQRADHEPAVQRHPGRRRG